MFFLALFGGAYIALDAILATIVATNGPEKDVQRRVYGCFHSDLINRLHKNIIDIIFGCTVGKKLLNY